MEVILCFKFKRQENLMKTEQGNSDVSQIDIFTQIQTYNINYTDTQYINIHFIICRFYASEIVLALFFLHNRGIIYRYVCLIIIIYKCVITKYPVLTSSPVKYVITN